MSEIKTIIVDGHGGHLCCAFIDDGPNSSKHYIGETPEEAIGKLAKIHLVNPIDESLLNDTDENVGLYLFKNVPTVQIKLLPCETTAY